MISEKRLEKTLQLESPYGAGEKAPAVRALCVSPLDRDVMVGTAACDIWEVHGARQVCSACIACMHVWIHGRLHRPVHKD